LAAQYGLNPKTVAKWRRRATGEDAPMGPRTRRSTVLTPLEEAVVVEFRRRTLLPLDHVLGRLRDTIPRLSRSALHRCLQRHDISRLPRDPAERSSKRGTFEETEIGYVHIDASELRTAEGKVYLFLAIDRVSKFTYVELRTEATMRAGAQFLLGVIAAFPYAIHTLLTDNGITFADAPRYRGGSTALVRGHLFDRVCRAHGITRKLTKPYHAWTNGQAERMIRTVKEATVRVFHYDTHVALATHLAAFVTAYNFARHLKRLRWRTPF
jgi:transposase InsO family protein